MKQACNRLEMLKAKKNLLRCIVLNRVQIEKKFGGRSLQTKFTSFQNRYPSP